MSNQNTPNICGTVEHTPCENLYNAVVGKKLTISIDMRYEPEVVRIIKSAIANETECKIFLSGYGLAGYQRKSQRELAKESGMSPHNVSRMFRAYIDKLGGQPYRGQLDALAITREQAYAAVERETALENKAEATERELEAAKDKLATARFELEERDRTVMCATAKIRKAEERLNNVLNGHEKMLTEIGRLKSDNDDLRAKLKVASNATATPEKIQRQLAGYKDGIRQREQTIAERDQTIARLEEELNRREYESNALRKRLTDAEALILKSETERTRATRELTELQEKWTSVLSVVGVVQKAESEVEAASNDILSRKVGEVFDHPGLLNALERIDVHTLADLLATTEGGLRRLKLGKTYVETIKRKLAEFGLSLKAA